MVAGIAAKPPMPWSVRAALVASGGLFVLFTGFPRTLWTVDVSRDVLLLLAAGSATAFASSLYEVRAVERMHPYPRYLGRGALQANFLLLPLLLVLTGSASGLVLLGAAVLLAGSVGYEFAYRRERKRRNLDENALPQQWGIQRPAGLSTTLPTELRGAFVVVLLGAALIALSIGFAFLAFLPALFMVVLFFDPEVDFNANLASRVGWLAVAGASVGVVGALWALAVPEWNFGFVLGLAPWMMAALALAGGAIGFEGARLTKEALARSEAFAA